MLRGQAQRVELVLSILSGLSIKFLYIRPSHASMEVCSLRNGMFKNLFDGPLMIPSIKRPFYRHRNPQSLENTVL